MMNQFKLAFTLFVCFALIIAFLMFIVWLEDKFDLKILPDNSSPRPVAMPPYIGGVQDTGDYLNVAAVLVPAVAPLAFACGIVEPKCASELQAAEALHRVDWKNGQPIYRYELKRIPQRPIMTGGMKALPVEIVPAKEIAEKISQNLSYAQRVANTMGYCFSGPIQGFDIDENRIRIELHGVSRQPLCYTGEIHL